MVWTILFTTINHDKIQRFNPCWPSRVDQPENIRNSFRNTLPKKTQALKMCISTSTSNILKLKSRIQCPKKFPTYHGIPCLSSAYHGLLANPPQRMISWWPEGNDGKKPLNRNTKKTPSDPCLRNHLWIDMYTKSTTLLSLSGICFGDMFIAQQWCHHNDGSS